LLNQIDPPVYVVDRYGFVLKAATVALLSGDQAGLDVVRNRLASKRARNDRHALRLQDGMQAIDAFKRLDLSAIPKDLGVSRPRGHLPELHVAGVAVTVAPHLLVHAKNADSTRGVGCVRFYTSKTSPLEGASERIHGALLHWFIDTHFGTLGKADPRLCFSIDIFRGSVSPAPRAFKRDRRHIAAACEEIADRWPTMVARLAKVEAYEEV
jgi:hypothetical protein